MKYIGIDYGSHNIGIAVSDASGLIAFPHSIAKRHDALTAIKEIVADANDATIVIGDTRAVSGEPNPITEKAEQFASALTSEGLRVERVFEAWSSVEAARFAPPSERHNDAAAAAILLQRYLDIHRPAKTS